MIKTRLAVMVCRCWQALIAPSRISSKSVRYVEDASRICHGSELMLSSYSRGGVMIVQPEDMRLHQGLVQGDARALAEGLELHRERLLQVVRFHSDPRLAKRMSAEDILQEAFLAASQRLAHYGSDGFTSPYTWLRIVLRQTLIDLHRRHIAAQARDARLEQEQFGDCSTSTRSMARELSGSITTPSGATMRAETHEALVGALERVAPADREIIALRHFESLGNQEISRVLGITEKAASIRYVRALRRLKQVLGRAGLGMSDLHAR